ncbi:MAG: PQQ-dependent sugar dehydrogenase [Armatimonadetes bacterium]|nr:PQQ-dependent sugar dehydrogenase [Armatimonadota bacterium]
MTAHLSFSVNEMKIPVLLFGLCAILILSAQGQTLRPDPWITGIGSQPVAVVQDPTNPSVQMVLRQSGQILVAVNGVVQPTPFMTLTVLTGSERGLLGMTFDPDYANNKTFYVYYTTSGPYMQLSRFTRDANDPLKGNPASELHLLRTLRPQSNHNSGTIRFGTDGYLYFPTGDGGTGGDPSNRAQNPNDLLGKMLRIDPRSDDFPGDSEANYSIPPDNPFVDNLPIQARTEIWAFGLRNPWKFSFDNPNLLGTGAMLLPDVGQDAWEEVNYEPVGKGGRNYGWSRYEGLADYNTSRSLAYGPHQPPIHVYSHAVGNSITGGYIYRGLALGSQAFGRYFFADYVAGKLFSIGLIVDPNTGEAIATDPQEHTAELGMSLGNISSIDVDSEGELLVVSYGGTVYKLARRNSTWLTDVDRADGLIIGGQVRSLVASDGKLLQLAPFSLTFQSPMKTTTVAGFKTNTTGSTTLLVTVEGKMNQPLNVPTVVKVRNWTTGQFDVIDSYSLTGAMDQHQSATSTADHVRSADGRIEVRVETNYQGLLIQPRLITQLDRMAVSAN